MRSQLVVAFLFVLVAYQPVKGDEEYFKKSIFKALKEKNGQFSSIYEATKANRTMLIGDKYSFKLNVHDLAVRANHFRRRFLFVNSSATYFINEHAKNCSSKAFNKTLVKHFLSNIAKEEVFHNMDHNVFGGNALLEVLYETQQKSKDSIKCEDAKKSPRVCTITFKDAAKVEYHLTDRDGHTMFPDKIVTFQKQGKDWQQQTVLSYANFTASFDAEPIVSDSPPVGYGCKRLDQENSPRFEPYFTTKFETEIEVELKAFTKSNRSRRGGFLKTIQAKINMNLEKGLIMVHSVDREESLNMTSLLDTNERVFYTTRMNQCIKMEVPAHALAPVNMSKLEIQEIIKQETQNLTFLGEHQVDKVLCNVFEEQVDTSQIPIPNYPKRPPGESRSDFFPDVVTLTAYYPKDPKYWSKSESVSMPKRVELRLLDRQAGRQFIKMTLNIKSFNPNPKDPEKFDKSKCVDPKSVMMG